MKTWTLKDPKEMPASSEADVQKYGRAYWSYTYDSDMPLMFNLMEGAVGDGTIVSAEEWVNKESSKGTEYLRLRKVKVVSRGETDAKTPQNDSSKLLELIYENTNLILEKLTQVPPPKSLKEAWDDTTGKVDNVAEYDPSEEPDLSSIPF